MELFKGPFLEQELLFDHINLSVFMDYSTKSLSLENSLCDLEE